MGDPRGCAAHVRKILKKDGTWMIVEPMAGDRLEENLNPVGRLYYAGTTMICVPTSLSQEVGAALLPEVFLDLGEIVEVVPAVHCGCGAGVGRQCVP